MTDLHFKWTARLQAAEEVLRTHTRIPKTKPTKGHKNEDEVEEVISYRRIRSMFRPFGGLFHLRHFVDAIRANDRFNKTILDLRIGPKGMYMPLEQIEDIRKTYYKQELADTLSLYPNMKLVFMVRDPRSFVSAKLRRVNSIEERRIKFLDMLHYWYKLNEEMVKICDSFPGRCHLLRHEDLVLRPRETLSTLVNAKLRLPVKSLKNYELLERPDGYNLTSWSAYLPPGTESALVDMLPLLQRLGYRPEILNAWQYRKIDLNPSDGFKLNILIR